MVLCQDSTNVSVTFCAAPDFNADTQLTILYNGSELLAHELRTPMLLPLQAEAVHARAGAAAARAEASEAQAAVETEQRTASAAVLRAAEAEEEAGVALRALQQDLTTVCICRLVWGRACVGGEGCIKQHEGNGCMRGQCGGLRTTSLHDIMNSSHSII